MTTFYRSGVKDFSFWNILSSREKKKKKADIEKNLNKMKWHVAIQLHLETGSFTNFCEYVFQDFHVTINFKAFFFLISNIPDLKKNTTISYYFLQVISVLKILFYIIISIITFDIYHVENSIF